MFSAPQGASGTNTAHTREIRVFTDPRTDVLHNIYAQRATFPVFEVTQVAGHPAIRTKDNVDGTTCFFRVAAAQTADIESHVHVVAAGVGGTVWTGEGAG